MLKDLRLAIGFLTVFPLAPGGAAQMGPARGAYFPLIGLVLGAILAGLDFAARQALPPQVVGALLVAALLVLTRAIHTEGFLDTCDGLFGGYSREKRLEILRDTHVGAFAVVGGIALLLLKWTLLAGIPNEVRASLLIVFPCLSRFRNAVYDGHLLLREEGGLGDGVPGGYQPVAGRIRTRYCSGGGRSASWDRRGTPARWGCRRVPGAGLVDQRDAGRDDRGHLRSCERGRGSDRIADGDCPVPRGFRTIPNTLVVGRSTSHLTLAACGREA